MTNQRTRWHCDSSRESIGCANGSGRFDSVCDDARWRCSAGCDFDYCGSCMSRKYNSISENGEQRLPPGLKMNKDGFLCRLYRDDYHHQGLRHYCGRMVGMRGYEQSCGRCDGRCGPTNGCQCRACFAVDQEEVSLAVSSASSVATCPLGHRLEMSNQTTRWHCDSSRESGGCANGSGGFDSVCGDSRWRCSAGCDFDYCGSCMSRKYTAARQRDGQSLVPAGVKMNRDGFLCRRSRDNYHRKGMRHYCGRMVGVRGYEQSCGRCDGRCGPTNGCQCRACFAVDQEEAVQNVVPPVPPQEESGSLLNRNINLSTQSVVVEEPEAAVSGPAAIEVENEDMLCVVCLAIPSSATLIHGETGHECCCFSCARLLQSRGSGCPICRQPIEGVIRTFKS